MMEYTKEELERLETARDRLDTETTKAGIKGYVFLGVETITLDGRFSTKELRRLADLADELIFYVRLGKTGARAKEATRNDPD